MKNILIVLILLSSGFDSFSQVTPVLIANKYEKSDLKTDSTISKLDKSVSKNPNTPPITVRICAPSRADMMRNQPLYIIKYGKKEYPFKNDSSKTSVFKTLFNPNDIEAISILKDKKAIEKYGDDGNSGVVIITIKDNKFADFKKNLKKYKAERKLSERLKPN